MISSTKDINVSPRHTHLEHFI